MPVVVYIRFYMQHQQNADPLQSFDQQECHALPPEMRMVEVTLVFDMYYR